MKRFRDIVLLFLAPVICAGMTGCSLTEDEAECRVDTRLTFRFSRYGTQLVGTEVPSLSVFVFDASDRFVGRWDEMQFDRITPQYTMTLPLPPGAYRFVVWGGLVDDNYFIGSPGQGLGHVLVPVAGETTLGEFAVRVRRNTRYLHSDPHNVVDHIPGALFFGGTEPVELEANVDRDIEIPLVKYTNTINLTVIGLPPAATRANPYPNIDINLLSANGSYGFDGEITGDSSILTYPQHDVDGGEPLTQTSTIHTLRPVVGNDLTLSFYNNDTGAEYYSADILADYIRRTQDEAGNYIYDTQEEIDAEDTFDIEIDMLASVGVTVRVNDYLVNSTGSIIQ